MLVEYFSFYYWFHNLVFFFSRFLHLFESFLKIIGTEIKLINDVMTSRIKLNKKIKVMD